MVVDYLEGQGNLVSRLTNLTTHIVTLLTSIINLLTKPPPDPPSIIVTPFGVRDSKTITFRRSVDNLCTYFLGPGTLNPKP